MYSFKPENILDKFSEYIHYYLVVHLLFTYCKIAPKPLDGLNLRVGIGQKSPYRESYTVNNHWKCENDVMSDVQACTRNQI